MKRILTLFSLILTFSVNAQNVLTANDLLALKSAGGLHISPDGTEILYSVSTPRGANEAAGSSHTEYFRMKLEDGIASPLFDEGVMGSSPKYSPDGKLIGFLYTAEDETKQVWYMDAAGGEISKLTDAPGGVNSFMWQAGKNGLAYLSPSPASKKEKELKERGYGFIYYEENLKNSNLFLVEFDENWKQLSEEQLTEGVQTWDFTFNRQGGSHLAYAAAFKQNDEAVSQAFVVDLSNGEVSNLTPDNFRGTISWVDWQDDKNILCYSGEGVYPKLSTVAVKGGKRKVLLDAAESGIIFDTPRIDKDFSRFVFTTSTPDDKSNIYAWDGKGDLNKLTDLNPILAEKSLGEQEVISYNARDGMEIEGLLIHPVGYQEGKKYPLIVYVHGGPESHHSNSWLSSYSTPAQVMAGKGYLVLYLNYRASTGYGVNFSMEGFGDPAGKEFDDIADGIDWTVENRGADRERVGLAGGSYGGYASGWFATYYTKYVKAVCMFVGISNSISKRGTTDIAYEELYVHSGKPLEEMWQLDLERSPVYWAHQSKTATLIYGGAADTRVHPSQSYELFRRMKMNNHPAVRLVQYPGEGHGNREQVGQIDVLYRQMAWLDWYVRDLKALDGPMPPLDISEQYGLDWEY